jgi:hypothetical protein
MGAHTNSMIAVIRKTIVSLRDARALVVKNKGLLAQRIETRDQAAGAVQMYYNAQGWDGQKKTREQEMDADKAYAVLVAKWEAAFGVVNEQLKAVRIWLDTASALSKVAMTQVLELEGYVKKKEAEKYWWQKTSVTAAKQFIAYAKAVI